jgi:hypothetical protein
LFEKGSLTELKETRKEDDGGSLKEEETVGVAQASAMFVCALLVCVSFVIVVWFKD